MAWSTDCTSPVTGDVCGGAHWCCLPRRTRLGSDTCKRFDASHVDSHNRTSTSSPFHLGLMTRGCHEGVFCRIVQDMVSTLRQGKVPVQFNARLLYPISIAFLSYVVAIRMVHPAVSACCVGLSVSELGTLTSTVTRRLQDSRGLSFGHDENNLCCTQDPAVDHGDPQIAS